MVRRLSPWESREPSPEGSGEAEGRVARAIDDAEVLSRRIEARAARVRESHAGAPQGWTVVQAARSSVE